MQPTLGRFVSLVNMTAAARIQCLRQVRRVAEDLQQITLMAHVDRAIASDRTALELDARWRLRNWRGQKLPEFEDLDQHLTVVLSMIHDMAAAHVIGDVVGDNLRRAAENVLVTIFPDGVEPILSLPYVERLFAVERISDLLVTDLSGDIETLGMGRLVLQMFQIAEKYRASLPQDEQTREFARVATAREHGQDRLFEVVAMILATFAGDETRSHAEVRTMLLAPLMLEDDAAREHVRRQATAA